LLINQQSMKPNLQRLLRASTYRGLHLPGNQGFVVDLYGPKAILCGSDSELNCLGDGTLQISIAPSSLPSSIFDERKQDEISTEFQPRLLCYRLRHLAAVNDSQVAVAEFTSAIRPLAGAFAKCLADDQKLPDAGDTVNLDFVRNVVGKSRVAAGESSAAQQTAFPFRMDSGCCL
jgi:hypothetical protein